MKKGLIVIGVLIFVMTLIAGSYIASYNSLTKYRLKIDDKKILIDDNLEKKAELVPKLISYAENYFDDEVIVNLSQAREELLKSNGIKEKSLENNNLNEVIDELMIKVEEHPVLNGNSDFAKLKREWYSLDNTIDTACKEYNEIVGIYNEKLKERPAKVMATMFDFDEITLYEM